MRATTYPAQTSRCWIQTYHDRCNHDVSQDVDASNGASIVLMAYVYIYTYMFVCRTANQNAPVEETMANEATRGREKGRDAGSEIVS